MKLSDVSIEKPVFATMLIMALVVFGAVFYTQLKVDFFPKVDYPIVTVTTLYPGADPVTVESQVSDQIEESISGLSGIRDLRSVSLESASQVIVQFELGVDLATATQDVRDRVGSITELPEGAEAPVITKLDLGAQPIMQLGVSSELSKEELDFYAEEVLRPEIERIQGVGLVEVLGTQERQLNVHVNPEALRSYGLSVDDLVGALRVQNVDLPGGLLTGDATELNVRTLGRVKTAEALSKLVVSSRGGSVITVGDLATVEDGFEDRRSLASLNGREALGILIQKQSDGNTVEVADKLRAALPELQAKAPEGTRIEVIQDNSIQIRGSIEAVEFDLVLGAFLAIFIILIFLRDLRATFISALALPTSVIGTFAFVGAFGFTLNLMTTLALSLSIGILIDDAIVVIENIVRRRTELGESPKVAAQAGTAEIGLAVLAVTLSLVAVFVPVAFMKGMLGQFFFEFGLTVAFAVLISLFVSFTLTPMLSSILLKEHDAHPTGLSGLIERGLKGLENLYRRVIALALRQRFLTMTFAAGALVATGLLMPLVGFDFVPIQDNGQFAVTLDLPDGTALDKTATQAEVVAARLREEPWITSTFTTVGSGVGGKVNKASILVTLADKHERGFHQVEAMSYVRRMLADAPGMTATVGALSAGGSSNAAPVQLTLQGNDLEALQQTALRIVARLREKQGYADLDTNFRPGRPEITVKVDPERAADFGLSSLQVASTVRTLIAGTVASQIEDETGRYDVVVQLPQDKREDMQTIASARMRAPSGALIEVASVADIQESSGPGQIERLNRQRQVTVSANLEGRALGDALAEVEAIAKEEMAPGVTYTFGGSGQVLQESVQSMLLALFLAIVMVYMILAAQFGSFIHPLTIMTALPFSLFGAFGALLIMHTSLSLFGMIGLIMLMGLVTKNAILLIDFVIQRRAAGMELNTALVEAGALRLRPILMTTAAMIFGMLPVAIGHGDGGELRAPMGIVIIGGLISSTVLTLVVLPVIYNLIERTLERLRALMRRFSKAPEPTTTTP